MEIRTERLILRKFNEEDYEHYKSLKQSEFSIKYEEDDIPIDEDIERRFQKILDNNQREDMYRLLIESIDEGMFYGYIILWCIDAPIREWEVGWGLCEKHTGRGIASEAAKALVKFAFEELNAHRVQANCNSENLASERLMKRIGMKKEGVLRHTRLLRGQWQNSTVYSILENEI